MALEVQLAKVITKRDMTHEGLITAEIEGWDGPIQVNYVSPYGGKDYAAFIAIPEFDQTILVIQLPNKDWYYLGSVIGTETDIFQPEEARRTGTGPEYDANSLGLDPDDYGLNDQSMSYGIRSPLGHKVILKEGRDEKNDRKAVVVESGRGAALKLDDSSRAQKVNLHSANDGAKVQLTDFRSEHSTIGPEGALVDAQGNVMIRSWEGGMKLYVRDGTNIEIFNQSTGMNAGGIGPIQKLSGQGNIKIQSVNGEVHISSAGNGVFIDCKASNLPPPSQIYTPPGGASFQVRSDNKIHLYAQNGIDLKSAGDINIKGRNVRIQSDTLAGGKVELNPLVSLDAFIGIRKTNSEIVWETLFIVFPFFMTLDFAPNYTYGPNNDARLII